MAFITVETLTDFANHLAEKVTNIFAKKTDIPESLPANGGDADTVNEHTVNADVPEGAVFTDTTYSVASEDADGLMSAMDKEKLNGIAANAQANKIENIKLNGVAVPISGKTVNIEALVAADLANYYTSEQVDQKIGAIPKFAISVVDSLPTSDISETTVYLKSSGSESQNLYTEYIYVDGKWEKLGEQNVDLTDYVTKQNALTGAAKKNATTIIFTRGDGSTFDVTIEGTTYSNMTGATASKAGIAGLVPPPAKGSGNRYLCADGTWKEIDVATTSDVDNIIAGIFTE